MFVVWVCINRGASDSNSVALLIMDVACCCLVCCAEHSHVFIFHLAFLISLSLFFNTFYWMSASHWPLWVLLLCGIAHNDWRCTFMQGSDCATWNAWRGSVAFPLAVTTSKWSFLFPLAASDDAGARSARRAQLGRGLCRRLPWADPLPGLRYPSQPGAQLLCEHLRAHQWERHGD